MADHAECQMPAPAPEHALLMGSVGVWDVKTKNFMGPGKPPIEGHAVDRVDAIGGFWTVSHYETTFFGQPFTGSCLLGYDPGKKKYVMTWADSMSSFLFIFEGEFDAATRTLTCVGKGPSMAGPGTADWKSTMTLHDADHQTLKMFASTPRGEVQLMENNYTRRK